MSDYQFDGGPISNYNEIWQGPIQDVGNCFEQFRFLIGGPHCGAHEFYVDYLFFNCCLLVGSTYAMGIYSPPFPLYKHHCSFVVLITKMDLVYCVWHEFLFFFSFFFSFLVINVRRGMFPFASHISFCYNLLTPLLYKFIFSNSFCIFKFTISRCFVI